MRRLLFVLLALALPALASGAVAKGPKASTQVRAADVAYADFNGDGRVDIVFAGSCGGRGCVQAVLNTRLGPVARTPIQSTGGGARFTDVTPVGGGAVVLLNGTAEARIVRGLAGTAPKATILRLPRAADDVVSGDFNGDGRVDLILLDGRDAFPGVSERGTFGFGAALPSPPGFQPTAWALGDVNGDENADLVVAGGRTLAVRAAVGDGTFALPVTVQLRFAPRALAVADVDVDATPDIAVATASGVEVFATVPDAGASFELDSVGFVAGTRPVGVVLADVTRDNLVDIIALNAGSGNISTSIASAGGGYGNAIRSVPIGQNPISLSLINFNNDGIPDVVVANASSGGLGAVSVLQGNGRGGFTLPGSPPTTPAPGGALPLSLTLAYNHPSPSQGFSWVCADIDGPSGALLTLELTDSQGNTMTGTLQLKQKATATAHGTFSFKITQLGSYTVKVAARKGGRTVTRTRTISVGQAQGSAACGP